MKASLALLAVFGVVLLSLGETTTAKHFPEQSAFVDADYKPPVADHADRHRRVTCDILSIGGKVGHAACAAHCLAMLKGYKGGYCDEKGVCHCRK